MLVQNEKDDFLHKMYCKIKEPNPTTCPFPFVSIINENNEHKQVIVPAVKKLPAAQFVRFKISKKIYLTN